MWDLLRPGLEPVSPALAGGFLTTVPLGKPKIHLFIPIHNEVKKLGTEGNFLNLIKGVYGRATAGNIIKGERLFSP